MFKDILIGTLIRANDKTASYVEQILEHGFESFAITFGGTFEIDPAELAEKVMPIVEANNIRIGAISLYGNPLTDDEKGEKAREEFSRLIDCAHLFKTDVVTGFTGRVPGCPIPESIPKFKEVWGKLADQAGEKNLRIAWENCPMGGDWKKGEHNIAHNPRAWELMFEALPVKNIGLEWEPCHQMVQLIDPMPQLREWVEKIFHIHGKDATVFKDVVRKYGISTDKEFAIHRHPGFGDCNWTDIISELRRAKFKGCINIEGWHDKAYSGELEMTGQVFALNYLKKCRGDKFVENPKV